MDATLELKLKFLNARSGRTPAQGKRRMDLEREYVSTYKELASHNGNGARYEKKIQEHQAAADAVFRAMQDGWREESDRFWKQHSTGNYRR